MAKGTRHAKDTVVTIDEALRRSMLKADEAYWRVSLNGSLIEPPQREMIIGVAQVYADIARALQVEREFEQSEIERIRNGNVQP